MVLHDNHSNLTAAHIPAQCCGPQVIQLDPAMLRDSVWALCQVAFNGAIVKLTVLCTLNGQQRTSHLLVVHADHHVHCLEYLDGGMQLMWTATPSSMLA